IPNMRNDLGPGKLRPEFPTLFEVLRKARGLSESGVLLMGNTVHLEGHLDSSNPSWGEGAMYGFVENPDIPGQPAGNDIDVIEALKTHLAEYETHLSVINLHNVDRTAHYNSNRAAYADRIRSLDEPIVSFWEWLQTEDGYANNTILVLVADHARHRWGTENDHRHHGDQCAGCRQIPMFLMGPGILADHTFDGDVDLTDLGVTLARLLDVELPYAHGNVIEGILTEPPSEAPVSERFETTPMGSFRLSQLNTGQGSTIWRDDVQVSDPAANRAEAPIGDQNGTHAAYCWRELHLSTEAIGNWPWRLQCHHQDAPDGVWRPLDGPLDIVWPFSRPGLSVDAGGQIWLAMVDNMTGNWEAASQAMRIARWSAETGWRGTEFGEEAVLYPTHPSLAHTEDANWIAYVTSDSLEDLTDGDTATPAAGSPVDLKARARHRRHIAVAEVTWDVDSVPSWNTVWRSYTSDHFVEGVMLPAPASAWDGWAAIDRVDRPALAKVGATLALGFIAYPTEGGTNLGLTVSTASETEWSSPVYVDVSGGVLPHVTPQWRNNRLAWSRVEGE
ncbi:MAG: sulfatase-like hydrolase/transferase, partial [Myxococcota bacterium]